MQRHPSIGSRAQAHASVGSTLEFHTRPNSTGALIGSLLLLGASFTLLVLGPTLLSRFQAGAESMPVGGYLNIAAASGIALGGGAAMISVVARLVRDIELRPYAALAPVLAVFTGFVLWGLRAQLPLGGVATEYVGVFALTVSVAGGGLVAQRGEGTRALGWLLAFFAPLLLLALVWANSGQIHPGLMLFSLSLPLRMFLGVLACASLLLSLLGEVARALRLRSSRGGAADFVSLPRAQAGDGAQGGLASSKYGSEPAIEPASLRQALASTSTDWREQPIPGTDAYLLQPQEFAPRGQKYTPKVSVWDFEDDSLALPKKYSGIKVFFWLLVIGGLCAAGLYHGAILPNRQKEAAARALLEQRQAEVKAAEAQEERSDQAKAAAGRLEELLKVPEANAPLTPEAAAAAPAAPDASAAGRAAPSMDGASTIPPKKR